MKFSISCLLFNVSLAAASGEEITPAQLEFFEAKIRPVLAENCYSCHNSVDKKKGDLALDHRAALLESKVIVPGDPAKSPLILAVRHAEDYAPMPSKAPRLSSLSIKHLEQWIAMGAPDPRLKKPTKEELAGQVDWGAIRDRRAEWWSFQPLVATAPPQADDPNWNGGVIDRFIFAELKAAGLRAAPVADPGTLVRRLHLVLTGLPPQPQVVAGFVADPSEEAYSALVDGLMSSPRYGERWARFWMDCYRYAESHGSEGDPEIPHAEQYRDYLIRAINADVPYDHMIREHLAGDLLEKPRINTDLGINESAIGPAHLRFVPHGFGVTDAYDEQITFTDNQIDVISKAMLGLTVSCARCHNHKFDPISQKDYYKFYGIMVSSRPAVVNVDSPELQNLHRLEIEKLKGEIRSGFGSHWLAQIDSAISLLEKADLGKIAGHHPLGAWAKLRDLGRDDFKRQLEVMRCAYREGLEHNEMAKKNASFYADLRDQATYDRWFRSGNGLGAKVSPAGAFALAGEGPKAFTGIYPAGVYSHLISDKHSGFLTSVFHRAEGDGAVLRALGSDATARFSVRSYPLVHGGLHPAPGLKPASSWVGFNKYKYWNGESGYFQINTSFDAAGKNETGRAWFGVFEAYAGNEGMRELGAPAVVLLAGAEKITDRASLRLFYQDSLRAAVSAWLAATMTDGQAQLLDGFVSQGYVTNEVAALPAQLKSLVDAYRKLEGAIRIPARAPGVVEGEPWDQPLLERGDHKKEGEPVARGFLEILPGKPYPKAGSGRLALAEDILANRNPLATRVLVNRLWHHTFGRGIVASADNFGRLGNQPTHPQLLDHLAAGFRQNGWSMKHLVRGFVMSRTFRSASSPPPANADKDPENLRLAFFTPRRLDAEAILDSIRFVAANGPPERAVFNAVKRNSLDGFLTTFNFPVPTSTVGVRNLTNVPAQSLALMNGRTAGEAARQWSQRVREDRGLATHRQKIDAIFMQAYARHATPAEIADCLAFIESETKDATEQAETTRRKGADAPTGDPYFRIAHAILNSKELIYVY
jgi:cytochrome c553